MFKKKRNLVKVRRHSQDADRSAAPSSETRASSTASTDGPTSTKPTEHRLLNVRLFLISMILLAVVSPSAHFWHAYQLKRHAQARLIKDPASVAPEELEQAIKNQERGIQFLDDDDIRHYENLAAMIERVEPKTRRDYSKLSQLYARMIDKDPQRRADRRRLAEVLFELQSYKAAIGHAKPLIILEPDDVDALRVMANSNFEQCRRSEKPWQWQPEDPSDGEQPPWSYFEHIIELKPDEVDAYVKLARWYDELGRSQEADQLIGKMVDRNPKSGEAYYIRYMRMYVQQDRDPDPADMRTALALAPDDPDIRFAAASLALNEGDWQTAKEYYERFIADENVDPGVKSAAFIGLGNAILAGGKPDDAVEVWLQGLDNVGSANPKLNFRLIEAYLTLGQPQKALDRINAVRDTINVAIAEATRTKADLATFVQQLQWLEASANLGVRKTNEAIALFESVAGQEFGDATVSFRANLQLGALYTAFGRHDTACLVYKRALDEQPENQNVRFNLAQSLARAKRFDESLAALIRLTNEDKVSPEVWLELARVRIARQASAAASERSWKQFDADLVQARERGVALSPLAMLQANRLALENRFDEAIKLLGAAQILNARDAVSSLQSRLTQSVLGGISAALAGSLDRQFGALLINPIPRRQLNDGIRLWVALGETFNSAGNREVADAMMQIGSKLFPESPSVAFSVASIHARNGDYETALKSLDQGIAHSQNDPMHQRLVDLKMNVIALLADPSSKIRRLEQMSNESPDDVELAFSLFQQFWASGDVGKKLAKQMIDRLEKLAGKNDTHWQIARATWLLNQIGQSSIALDEAEQLVRTILRKRPSWHLAHLLASDIALSRGDTEAAIGSLKTAIKFGEQRPAVYRNLLTLLLNQQEFDEADKYLARLKQTLLSDPEILPIALQLSTHRKQFSQALDLARAAVAERKSDPMTHIWLGHVLAMDEQFEPAETSYQDAVRADPNSLAAYLALIRFYVSRNQIESARTTLEKLQATKAVGDKPELVLGHCYALLKEFDRAKAEYLKAAKKYSDDDQILRIAAAFLLGRGDDEAEEILNTLQQRNPGDLSIRRGRALHLGRMNDAQSVVEALELVPESDAVTDLRLRSQLLDRLGGPENRRKAIALLERIVAQPEEATPNDRYRLARLYMREGKLGQATDHLLMISYLPDVSTDHLATCVQFLIREGTRLAEADVLLTRLEQVESESIRPVLLRARWLHAKHSTDKGAEHLKTNLERFAKDEDFPKVLLQTAQMLEEMKKLADAETLYQRLTDHTPTGFVQYALFLGRLRRGDDAARECLSRVISDDETVATAALTAAATLPSVCTVSDKNVARIRKSLEQAHRENPQSVDIAKALAENRLFSGEYAEAEQLYRNCLRSNNRDVVAWNNLAIALSKQEKHQPAQDAIVKAIGIAGPMLELLDTQGLIQLEAGATANALERFRLVTSDASARDVHFLHMAMASLRSNQPGQAHEWVQRALENGLEVENLSRDDSQYWNELKQQFNDLEKLERPSS